MLQNPLKIDDDAIYDSSRSPVSMSLSDDDTCKSKFSLFNWELKQELFAYEISVCVLTLCTSISVWVVRSSVCRPSMLSVNTCSSDTCSSCWILQHAYSIHCFLDDFSFLASNNFCFSVLALNIKIVGMELFFNCALCFVPIRSAFMSHSKQSFSKWFEHMPLLHVLFSPTRHLWKETVQFASLDLLVQAIAEQLSIFNSNN